MSEDLLLAPEATASPAPEPIDLSGLLDALSSPVPEYGAGDMGHALARAVTRGVRSDPEWPSNGFGTAWADQARPDRPGGKPLRAPARLASRSLLGAEAMALGHRSFETPDWPSCAPARGGLFVVSGPAIAPLRTNTVG